MPAPHIVSDPHSQDGGYVSANNIWRGANDTMVRITDRSISNVDVLVIGAGPTGLGAAKRLNHIVGTQL